LHAFEDEIGGIATHLKWLTRGVNTGKPKSYVSIGGTIQLFINAPNKISHRWKYWKRALASCHQQLAAL
jgi:hypothetical protein